MSATVYEIVATHYIIKDLITNEEVITDKLSDYCRKNDLNQSKMTRTWSDPNRKSHKNKFIADKKYILKEITEEIRPHPYHEYLWVSESGRCFSDNPNCVYRPDDSSVLYPLTEHDTSNGIYRHYKISYNSSAQHISTHILVAETFLGLREEGQEVHHIDENPKNNHWTNLTYTTRGEHLSLHRDNYSRTQYVVRNSHTGERFIVSNLTRFWEEVACDVMTLSNLRSSVNTKKSHPYDIVEKKRIR